MKTRTKYNSTTDLLEYSHSTDSYFVVRKCSKVWESEFTIDSLFEKYK